MDIIEHANGPSWWIKLVAGLSRVCLDMRTLYLRFFLIKSKHVREFDILSAIEPYQDEKANDVAQTPQQKQPDRHVCFIMR